MEKTEPHRKSFEMVWMSVCDTQKKLLQKGDGLQ